MHRLTSGIFCLVRFIVFSNPSSMDTLVENPSLLFAFAGSPNRVPELSQSRAGFNSTGAKLPLNLLINSANSRIVVSRPEARL